MPEQVGRRLALGADALRGAVLLGPFDHDVHTVREQVANLVSQADPRGSCTTSFSQSSPVVPAACRKDSIEPATVRSRRPAVSSTSRTSRRQPRMGLHHEDRLPSTSRRSRAATGSRSSAADRRPAAAGADADGRARRIPRWRKPDRTDLVLEHGVGGPFAAPQPSAADREMGGDRRSPCPARTLRQCLEQAPHTTVVQLAVLLRVIAHEIGGGDHIALGQEREDCDLGSLSTIREVISTTPPASGLANTARVTTRPSSSKGSTACSRRSLSWLPATTTTVAPVAARSRRARNTIRSDSAVGAAESNRSPTTSTDVHRLGPGDPGDLGQDRDVLIGSAAAADRAADVPVRRVEDLHGLDRSQPL